MNEAFFKKQYGPWAVITGASDGIGKAFALRLAELGFNVVLVARREELLNGLARVIEDTFDVETKIIAADLVTRLGADSIFEQTAELDVGLLVTAAGFGTSGPFIDSIIKDELALISLNCSAVVEQSFHFAQRLKQRGCGGLIFLSSIVAFQGVPRSANYAASKAYIQSLAEGLRKELSPWNIDVIASAPGPIDSGFAQRANMQMYMALSPKVVANVTLKALGKKTTVRPGWLSKFLGYSLSMLPRWGRIRVMTLVMGGMTKHQQLE